MNCSYTCLPAEFAIYCMSLPLITQPSDGIFLFTVIPIYLGLPVRDPQTKIVPQIFTRPNIYKVKYFEIFANISPPRLGQNRNILKYLLNPSVEIRVIVITLLGL